MAPPAHSNKINNFMHGICRLAFLCGIPNYWYDDLGFSKTFTKIYKQFSIIVGVVFGFVLVSTWLSFAYDMGLSEKQEADRLNYLMMHIEFSVAVIWGLYFRENIRNIQQMLTDEFLSAYVDKKLESALLSKLLMNYRVYMFAVSCVVPTQGLQALMYAKESGTGFAAPVTHWPRLHDHSVTANVSRFIIFTTWAFFVAKLSGTYLIAITTTICMSFQFKNLQSYFKSLNDLFKESIGTSEKNTKYEKQFIQGIIMHEKMLNCANEVQRAFNGMYSGQVITNTWGITVMLWQMASVERNFENIAMIVSAMFVCLAVTGMFMCHAGDISLEAAGVAGAMYESGWQHVQGGAAAKRVAVLLTVAIGRAQKPLKMTALYIIEMSYDSYVTLVKTTYSIFSVII